LRSLKIIQKDMIGHYNDHESYDAIGTLIAHNTPPLSKPAQVFELLASFSNVISEYGKYEDYKKGIEVLKKIVDERTRYSPFSYLYLNFLISIIIV